MKKILFLVLSILGVMIALSSAFSEEEKSFFLFSYTIKGNGEAVITGFDWSNNKGNDIYVPRQIDGYNVSEIGEYAFSAEDASIDHLIGEKVVVILPDTIRTIRAKAFFCTNVSSVSISQNVELIEPGAFAGCKNITQISLDVNNSSFALIDDFLYAKSIKTLISAPHIIESFSIPNGIVAIGDYSFYGCEFTGACGEVFFPKTISLIGEYSFAKISCEGQNTIYCRNVSEIQSHAFFGAKLYGISMPKVVKIGASAFQGADLRDWNCPKVEEIGEYSFAYACAHSYNKDFLSLPSTLKKIGEHSFEGYSGANYINLSRTQLTEIPAYAFKNVELSFNAEADAKISLPDGLRSIGEKAFCGMCHVKDGWFVKEYYYIDITIPDSVEYIGPYAFSAFEDMIDLHSNSDRTTRWNLVLPAETSQLLEIGDNAFWYTVISNEEFVVPNKVEKLGSEVFSNTNISMIVLPSSIKEIGTDICDRAKVKLKVTPGSYPAQYVSDNGYSAISTGETDMSWLD